MNPTGMGDSIFLTETNVPPAGHEYKLDEDWICLALLDEIPFFIVLEKRRAGGVELVSCTYLMGRKADVW